MVRFIFITTCRSQLSFYYNAGTYVKYMLVYKNLGLLLVHVYLSGVSLAHLITTRRPYVWTKRPWSVLERIYSCTCGSLHAGNDARVRLAWRITQRVRHPRTQGSYVYKHTEDFESSHAGRDRNRWRRRYRRCSTAAKIIIALVRMQCHPVDKFNNHRER